MSCHKEAEQAKEDFANEKCKALQLDLVTNGDEDLQYLLYIYYSNAGESKSVPVKMLSLLIYEEDKFWEMNDHNVTTVSSITIHDEDKPLRRASDTHKSSKLNFIKNLKASFKIGKSLNSKERRFCFSEKIESVVEQRLSETGMSEFADKDNSFEGKYELFEILGEGTTGVVKKCIDRKTRESFAAKIIRTNDTEIIKAIKNEFLIQKQLSHPNIVKVYELFYNPIVSQIVIVMELIDGVELFDDVIDNGTFDGNNISLLLESDAKKTFGEILSGIQHIHSKGICHRDIKPQNIIFSPHENCIKITDFNVSKHFRKSEGEIIKMMTNTGTLEYRAPETFCQQEYT